MGSIRRMPLLAAVAGLLLLAAPAAQAAKVMVAPGKTECISHNMEAAHFEVSINSLGAFEPDPGSIRQ